MLFPAACSLQVLLYELHVHIIVCRDQREEHEVEDVAIGEVMGWIQLAGEASPERELIFERRECPQ